MSTDPAAAPDRFHALDAVRAYALLLGVVLHSCASFLPALPIPPYKLEPALVPSLLYYAIHMFRMSVFYLMAGFFARMMVERRGVNGFVRDRAKRILLPLVAGWPVVMLTITASLLLGAWPHGTAYLESIVGVPAGGAAPQTGGALDLAHLWFLYYLLMFYVLALALRAVVHWLDARGRLRALCDRAVAFLMRGPWGAVALAVPVALYFDAHLSWAEWLGLPAPSSVVPDVGGIVGYVVPFGLGWLLHRQVPSMLALRSRWALHLVLALILTAVCLGIIGTTPNWFGPHLQGAERALYAMTYLTAVWCWVFGLVGAAVRFLSAHNRSTRYVADASYWIYLMHMGPILFFITLLRPYHLHWAIMLAIMVTGTMLVLLPTYHYLVRFTWVGATLNGRRHPRPSKLAPAGAAVGD